MTVCPTHYEMIPHSHWSTRHSLRRYCLHPPHTPQEKKTNVMMLCWLFCKITINLELFDRHKPQIKSSGSGVSGSESLQTDLQHTWLLHLIVGIPMGTDCDLLLLICVLYWYVSQFMAKHQIYPFKHTFINLFNTNYIIPIRFTNCK